MAFLGHLLRAAAGVTLLAVFPKYPRTTAFCGIAPACGYLGSPLGLLGNVYGLLFGAVLGGIAASLVHGLSVLPRMVSKRQHAAPVKRGPSENP